MQNLHLKIEQSSYQLQTITHNALGPLMEEKTESFLGPDKTLTEVEILDANKPKLGGTGQEEKTRYANKTPAKARTSIGSDSF